MEDQTPSTEDMLFTVFILIKYNMEIKVLLSHKKFTYSLYIFILSECDMDTIDKNVVRNLCKL
jgi:hypothetical protein